MSKKKDTVKMTNVIGLNVAVRKSRVQTYLNKGYTMGWNEPEPEQPKSEQLKSEQPKSAVTDNDLSSLVE